MKICSFGHTSNSEKEKTTVLVIVTQFILKKITRILHLQNGTKYNMNFFLGGGGVCFCYVLFLITNFLLTFPFKSH